MKEINAIEQESPRSEGGNLTEKSKSSNRMQMEMGTCVRGYERRYIKMIMGLRKQCNLALRDLGENLQTALDSVRDGLTDIIGGGVQWRASANGREINYLYVAAPGTRVVRRMLREGARA